MNSFKKLEENMDEYLSDLGDREKSSQNKIKGKNNSIDLTTEKCKILYVTKKIIKLEGKQPNENKIFPTNRISTNVTEKFIFLI